ncbi:hypothetical protein FIBSPDRAFT_878613 [Athelia psychrophila]|uniref:Uncharacterized protein n=1 Tax=Athelia psychrophila TaxID=1759441 RepID=A0A167UV36_9AGAM|nr:hypothetical protein FIBSPDRAFT_878613 [Fibularhizoctonia sp. CBS 109695]
MSYADLSEVCLQLHSPVSHGTYHTQAPRNMPASHSSNEKVRRDASIRRPTTSSSHH